MEPSTANPGRPKRASPDKKSPRARGMAQKLVSKADDGGVVTTVVHVAAASSCESTPGVTVEMPADTLHLMGMASSLPSSNLFVNYPHTLWEKDAEGNRILIKTESEDGDDDSPHMILLQTDVSTKNSDQARPHICEMCDKSFVKREHLTKHLRIHKNDNKRYSCEFCQKAFRDRYELVRHTRRHTGDFPFRCDDCNKGFMRHERYMTHLRWHSGERPFQCNMCEKSFRDRSELNRHSRRHTGDLPYKCETCGKGFLRRERYVTHVRIHTGEKPFVCAVCSRGYRDRRELKKHQVAHNHSGQSAPIPGNQLVSPIQTNTSHNSILTSESNISGRKTILIQQTVSLPSEPIPRELLSDSGPQVYVAQPLNPATIPLPPSVASALQSINEKVAAKQARALQQTITLTKQEPQTQVITIPSNATLTAATTNSTSGGGPLFYYFMPGNVPHNIVSEGGATVRVTTGEGNVATAQLVSVPASAIQGVQTSVASGSFPNWILEGTSAHDRT